MTYRHFQIYINFIKKESHNFTLTSATLAGVMSPSYGHPNAQETYLQ